MMLRDMECGSCTVKSLREIVQSLYIFIDSDELTLSKNVFDHIIDRIMVRIKLNFIYATLFCKKNSNDWAVFTEFLLCNA